jgi:transposase
MQPVFGCEKDALKAAKKWRKSLKSHCCEFNIESIARYSKAGKPPKGATPDIIEYKLSGKMTDDKKEQDRLRNRLGRFILGTNVTTNVRLTAKVMLATYSEQQDVERGFRLDSIDLKLPSRIDALMMVMTLTLMVYNVAEYEMRETMAKQKTTLPNQKKETNRKTHTEMGISDDAGY